MTPTQIVPSWPRITAAVDADGTGSLTVNGTERPCVATSLEELRTGILARCVAIAVDLRRPVRLTVNEPGLSYKIAVRPTGIVQLLSDDGTIEPSADLTVAEGRCRVCRRLQPITASCCVQCEIEEPHRVETLPRKQFKAFTPRTGPVPLDSDADADVGTQPLTIARVPLRLFFNTQPYVDVQRDVAIGRDPSPIDGRQTVTVASPESTLSRTHILIDVDDDGRILVTDHNSGNGTCVEAERSRWLVPGMPSEIQAGMTLLIGDVVCTVDLAPDTPKADSGLNIEISQ